MIPISQNNKYKDDITTTSEVVHKTKIFISEINGTERKKSKNM